MINILPEFESRQVLTDDELNWLTTYLDSQNRQSRMMLLGSGLLAGLQVRIEGSGIRLSNGVALTSAGYILSAGPDTAGFVTFTRQAKYEAGEKEKFAFHYMADGQPGAEDYSGSVDYPSIYFSDFKDEVIEVFEGNINRGGPLDINAAIGKVMMIYQEITRKELKDCEDDSCQDRGKKYQFNTRFLLVAKEDALKLLNVEYGLQDAAEDAISRLAFPQLYLPDVNILKPVFGDFPVNDQLDEAGICGEYGRCITDFVRFLSGNRQEIDTALRNLKNYVDRSNSGFSVVEDLLTAIDRTGIMTEAAVQPYKFQVVYDLCLTWTRAYRELQQQAWLLTSRVSGLSGSHPQHVFCGIAEPSNPEFDYPVSTRFSVYRHRFTGRFQQAGQAYVVKSIALMLSRLKSMAGAFDEQLPATLKELRVISGGTPGGRLSDQPVPFYLKQEAVNVWNAEAAQIVPGRRITRYGVHDEALSGTAAAPFNTQSTSLQSSNTFFRIEGVHGLAALTALNTLFQIRKKRALPFEVIMLRLNEKSPANYSFNFSVNEDLESLYQVVRRELKKQVALNASYLSSLQIKAGEFSKVETLLDREMGSLFLNHLTELNDRLQLRNPLPLQLSDAVQATNIVTNAKATTIARTQQKFAELEDIVNLEKQRVTTMFRTDAAQTFTLQVSKPGRIPSGRPFDVFEIPIRPFWESLDGIVNNLKNSDRFRNATDLNFYTRLHDVTKTLGNTENGRVLFMRALRLLCALKLQDLYLPDNLQELDAARLKTNLETLLLPACTALASELKKYNADQIGSDDALREISKSEMKSCTDRIRFEDDWVKVVQIDEENNKRNGGMGNENLLERFAKAHPGLGHGFGVPQGGTYVLVYDQANRVTADFSLPYIISSYLRPISYTLLEQKTLTLSGIITGPAGDPVKTALLVGTATVFSDDQGFYNALVSENTKVKVIVKSEDYQYFEQEVEIGTDGQTLHIPLQKIETGFTTTVKFVNQLGENKGFDIFLVDEEGKTVSAVSGELKVSGKKGSTHSFRVADPRYKQQEVKIKIGSADKEEVFPLAEVGRIFFRVTDQTGQYDPSLLKSVKIVDPSMELENLKPADGMFNTKVPADITETPTVEVIYDGNTYTQPLKVQPDEQRVIVLAGERPPSRNIKTSVLMLYAGGFPIIRNSVFNINGEEIRLNPDGLGTGDVSTDGQLKMDPALLNCPPVKIENPEEIAGSVVIVQHLLIQRNVNIGAENLVHTFNRALTTADIAKMTRVAPELNALSRIPDITKLNSITLIMERSLIDRITRTLGA